MTQLRKLRPPNPSRLREASGVILVVIFALIIVLAAWAFSMNYLSSGATRQSARAQFRERCTDLAQMAIMEAVHYLRTRVNSEDQAEIFEAFRVDDPPDLELDLDDLTFTRTEADRFPEYSVSTVSVEIPRRTSIGVEAAERVPYEAVGIARISVTVDGPKGARVTRVEEYGFRSVLTAPTRPLDMLTFFLGDPSGVLSRNQYNESANATMLWIEQKTAEAVQFFQKWEATTKDLADTAREGTKAPDGGHLGAVADRIEQTIVPLFRNAYTRQANTPGYWPAPDWDLTEPYQSSAGQFQVHKFADGILVYTAAPEVDLRIFNLPVLVGTRIQQTRSRNAPVQALNDEMTRIYRKYKQYEQQQKVPPQSEIDPDIDRFEQSAKDTIAYWHQNAMDFHEILLIYKNFQDSLIEVGGKERRRIENRIRRLNAREQPWRNHYKFTGEGAAAKATEFLARNPPPSGVVWVQDPKERLTIDIKNLTGRLQVISAGDVTVESATVSNPNEDVLIVVGYGEVDVKGQTQAAIISWGGRYASRGQDLQGSLILNSIHKLTSDATFTEIFSGTLTRLDAIQSGPGGNRKRPPPDLKSLHIAFSPVPPYRKPETR